jgi:predicted nuclease of predicted toxin-antitoxin system
VKLLADECTDAGMVAALRADGHDVVFAVESCRGWDDEAILGKANPEGRILLTEDKDFGELVYRQGLIAGGIILLRFEGHERSLLTPRLRWLVGEMPDHIEGHFVVLEPGKARFRPLSSKRPRKD